MKELESKLKNSSNQRALLKNSAIAVGAATMGASMLAKGSKAFEEQGEGSGSLRRGDAATGSNSQKHAEKRFSD
jgi:hypothetical protein